MRWNSRARLAAKFKTNVWFDGGGFSKDSRDSAQPNAARLAAAESLSALFKHLTFASKAHSFPFSSRHRLWINRKDAAEEKSCIKYELLFA
jgi:hypothetical protein